MALTFGRPTTPGLFGAAYLTAAVLVRWVRASMCLYLRTLAAPLGASLPRAAEQQGP